MATLASLELRMDTTVFMVQLGCVRALIEAKAEWEVQLALSALRALNESAAMANAARLELGLDLPARVDIGVRVYPHAKAAA